MLHAQLHGKFRTSQENLEDVLTSNVFGAFEYVGATQSLLSFLGCSEGPDAAALRDLLRVTTRVEYVFWPWLEEPGCKGCEPDVVLRLFADQELRGIVLVEAKYRSGKSPSSAPDSPSDGPLERANDQLAREWANVERIAAKLDVGCFLVYLTAAYTFPRAEIEESQSELRGLREGSPGKILWLSWRSLASVADTTSSVIRDVVRLMRERYVLTFFEGVAVASQRAPWAFVSTAPERSFAVGAWPRASVNWTFRDGETSAMAWNIRAHNPWRWTS